MEKYISVDEISGIYYDLALNSDVDRIFCSSYVKKNFQEIYDMAEIVDPYFISKPLDFIVDETLLENAVAFGNEKEILEIRYIKPD